VIDWAKVIAVLRAAGFDGVMSVECGTEEQGERSIAHLKEALGDA